MILKLAVFMILHFLTGHATNLKQQLLLSKTRTTQCEIGSHELSMIDAINKNPSREVQIIMNFSRNEILEHSFICIYVFQFLTPNELQHIRMVSKNILKSIHSEQFMKVLYSNHFKIDLRHIRMVPKTVLKIITSEKFIKVQNGNYSNVTKLKHLLTSFYFIQFLEPNELRCIRRVSKNILKYINSEKFMESYGKVEFRKMCEYFQYQCKYREEQIILNELNLTMKMNVLPTEFPKPYRKFKKHLKIKQFFVPFSFAISTGEHMFQVIFYPSYGKQIVQKTTNVENILSTNQICEFDDNSNYQYIMDCRYNGLSKSYQNVPVTFEYKVLPNFNTKRSTKTIQKRNICGGIFSLMLLTGWGALVYEAIGTEHTLLAVLGLLVLWYLVLFAILKSFIFNN